MYIDLFRSRYLLTLLLLLVQIFGGITNINSSELPVPI